MIKYFDFKFVADYFYNLILNNSAEFEGLVKEKNITNKLNAAGEANISILSNWCDISKIENEGMLLEDMWEENLLGFSCLIQIESGHEANSQKAFNLTTSILQRLRRLLRKQKNKIIKNNEMEIYIADITFTSGTELENPYSDFSTSFIRIDGTWKYYDS
jgi:hypothetical protein